MSSLFGGWWQNKPDFDAVNDAGYVHPVDEDRHTILIIGETWRKVCFTDAAFFVINPSIFFLFFRHRRTVQSGKIYAAALPHEEVSQAWKNGLLSKRSNAF